MTPLPFRLPDRALVVTQLVRGTAIWVPLRIIAAGLAAVVPGGHASPLRISGAAAVFLLALTGVLSLLDTVRHHEHRFLANLGVPLALAWLWTIIPGAGLEIAIQILSRR